MRKNEAVIAPRLPRVSMCHMDDFFEQPSTYISTRLNPITQEASKTNLEMPLGATVKTKWNSISGEADRTNI